MQRSQIRWALILLVALLLSLSAACSTSEETAYDDLNYEDFTHSSGISDNGFWKDITALDYVELDEYVGIFIPREIHAVSDQAIRAEIDNVLAYFTYEEQITDRAIVDGDTVNIDFVGSIDGIEFSGGSTEGLGTQVTIGVTNYIDGFLEQLIGHTPGETFDIEVTFPEDYGNEDLSGKDAVFAITLNYIVETVTPELSDHFVAENLSSLYGFTTVADMEADIRSGLQNSAVANYVQDYIFENTTILSVPQRLLKYQEYSLIYYFEDYADYYDMSLDEFLIAYMSIATTDELLEQYHDDNTKTASFYLIIQAIAEDAQISITDVDIAAYFIKYVGTEDFSGYAETYGMPYLKLTVLHQTVLDFLVENAVLG